MQFHVKLNVEQEMKIVDLWPVTGITNTTVQYIPCVNNLLNASVMIP